MAPDVANQTIGGRYHCLLKPRSDYGLHQAFTLTPAVNAGDNPDFVTTPASTAWRNKTVLGRGDRRQRGYKVY